MNRKLCWTTRSWTAAPVNRRALLRCLPFAATVAAALAWLRPPAARAEAAALFLQELPINGTAYYRAPKVPSALKAGQPLTLRREPANAHDALAIEVLTAGGVKLGYVPRTATHPSRT